METNGDQGASGMSKAVMAAPPLQVPDGEKTVTLTRQAALARHLGVKQQAISAWVRRGWAPMKRVQQISSVTGVPARELMDPRVLRAVEVA